MVTEPVKKILTSYGFCFCATVLLWIVPQFIHAQDCDSTVPIIEVDLSQTANGVFLSPSVIRAGNCCGTSNPDRCIGFNITLNEAAQGIIFDICAGAVPPGALFYQIGCGPPQPVGQMICLDGAGPHFLTFCKPGNNSNQYCITSVPAPTAGPDTLASEGCTAQLSSSGYDPATIVWNSVFPGNVGDYDQLLNCTNCPNPIASAPAEIIDYADFQVCGMPLGGCTAALVCDTVRVYFASTLAVTTEPHEPAICFGDGSVLVTATGTGGYPPYTFDWSDGHQGHQLLITQIGSYTVFVTDGSGCPPAEYTFYVNELSMPVSVTVPDDFTVCDLIVPISLSGSYTGADSALWWGGEGQFLPDAYSNDIQYIPTDEELQQGSVSLSLGVQPGSGCPGGTATVVVTFAPFEPGLSAAVQHPSCAGSSDGSIQLTANTDLTLLEIQWEGTNAAGAQATGLPAGSYSATVTNAIGCSETIEVVLVQPDPLQVQVVAEQAPLCANSADGIIHIEAAGGVAPYQIEWSNPVPQGWQPNNLPEGTYTATISDANGCSIQTTVSLNAPLPIVLTSASIPPVCPGNMVTLTVQGQGGIPAYTFHWGHTPSSAPEVTFIAQASATYTVHATDANGCLSNVLIIEIEVPTMYPGLLAVSNDTVICPGAAASLVASYLGAYPPYAFSWSHGLEATAGPHAVSPPQHTTYQVTVTDACGQSLSAEVNVGVVEIVPPISAETLVTGCSPLSVLLYDEANTGTGFTHTWYVDGTAIATGNNVIHVFDIPGVFAIQLVVTSAEGCTATRDDIIVGEAFETPQASLAISSPVLYIDEPELEITNTTAADHNIVVWTIEGQEFNDLITLHYTFADTGTYAVQLYVENEFGCADSITLLVVVKPVYNIIVPNAFTPGSMGNGGQYIPGALNNQVFYPFADYVSEFRMNVFNRWGELIFESVDFSIGWDGTYRNKPCPQDVYAYRIDFVFSDGVEITKVGDVTLFR